MAQTMPPLPLKTPAVTDSGAFTDTWVKWLVQLFDRVGGNVSSTNTELISDIQTISNTLSDHTALINGLGVGPNL